MNQSSAAVFSKEKMTFSELLLLSEYKYFDILMRGPL